MYGSRVCRREPEEVSTEEVPPVWARESGRVWDRIPLACFPFLSLIAFQFTQRHVQHSTAQQRRQHRNKQSIINHSNLRTIRGLPTDIYFQRPE